MRRVHILRVMQEHLFFRCSLSLLLLSICAVGFVTFVLVDTLERSQSAKIVLHNDTHKNMFRPPAGENSSNTPILAESLSDSRQNDSSSLSRNSFVDNSLSLLSSYGSNVSVEPPSAVTWSRPESDCNAPWGNLSVFETVPQQILTPTCASHLPLPQSVNSQSTHFSMAMREMCARRGQQVHVMTASSDRLDAVGSICVSNADVKWDVVQEQWAGKAADWMGQLPTALTLSAQTHVVESYRVSLRSAVLPLESAGPWYFRRFLNVGWLVCKLSETERQQAGWKELPEALHSVLVKSHMEVLTLNPGSEFCPLCNQCLGPLRIKCSMSEHWSKAEFFSSQTALSVAEDEHNLHSYRSRSQRSCWL